MYIFVLLISIDKAIGTTSEKIRDEISCFSGLFFLPWLDGYLHVCDGMICDGIITPLLFTTEKRDISMSMCVSVRAKYSIE